MFIALADELKKQRCSRLIKFGVTEFINDEQRNGAEMALLMTGNAIKLCDSNLIKQVLSGEEVNSMSRSLCVYDWARP